MLFYPADAFPVSRPNTSSTYRKVERRIIHSDDYQEMGSTTEGSSLIDTSRIQRKCYSKRGSPLLSPSLIKKTFVDDYFSDLLLFKYRKTKSSTTLSLVTTPSFLDQGIAISGASVSFLHLVLTLFWAFVDGTLMFAALPIWSRSYKSSTEVKTSRQTYPWPYGQYDWRFTSVSCRLWLNRSAYIPFHLKKDFWDKLKTLFGTTSFTSCLSFIQTSPTQTRFALNMLRQISLTSCHSSITQPKLGWSSSNLPCYDSPQQSSSRVQLFRLYYRSNHYRCQLQYAICHCYHSHGEGPLGHMKILHARISAVQISEGPSSLINRTNVIRRGLPNQNHWKNQTHSH